MPKYAHIQNDDDGDEEEEAASVNPICFEQTCCRYANKSNEDASLELF